MESFTSRAPVRADLGGGTLDIWPLYNLVGGCRTINVALDLWAAAHFELAEHDEFRFEIQVGKDSVTLEHPLTLSEAKFLEGGLSFPAMIVSIYLGGKESLPKKFIKLKIETNVPKGSGLGGSSSLCVAIVSGLARIFQDFRDQGWQWKMLDWVKDAESQFLRTATGTQDYLAALFGGLRAYRYQTGRISTEVYPDSAFEGLSKRMVILFSGEIHHSGLTNWEIFKAAFEGDPGILGGLASIQKIADEIDRELHANNIRWDTVGTLINQEWDERKRTFRVHTARLDEIIRFVRTQRILGCKVCGAASGGSLLALVEPSERESFEQACRTQKIEVLQCAPTESGVQITPSNLYK